jgi:thiamine-phosphate pyrophosphorylase
MYHKNYNLFTYIDNLNQDNVKKFNKNINLILRNYKTKFNYRDLFDFISFCKKNKRKIYLANDIKTAKTLDFNGAYIPSFNKLAYKFDSGVKKEFKLLGSAHNIQEVIIKINQKIDMIFISPLFKKDAQRKFLGVCKFSLIKKDFSKKFIALGGINKNNKKLLKLLRVSGYASIKYFNTQEKL